MIQLAYVGDIKSIVFNTSWREIRGSHNSTAEDSGHECHVYVFWGGNVTEEHRMWPYTRM
jgi:hypothetical protein